MIQQHEVQFVDDKTLPTDVHWAILRVDGATYCVVKRSKVCPGVLEQAWAGYRTLARAS